MTSLIVSVSSHSLFSSQSSISLSISFAPTNWNGNKYSSLCRSTKLILFCCHGLRNTQYASTVQVYSLSNYRVFPMVLLLLLVRCWWWATNRDDNCKPIMERERGTSTWRRREQEVDAKIDSVRFFSMWEIRRDSSFLFSMEMECAPPVSPWAY